MIAAGTVKPTILVIDRASLDCRILGLMLEPVAEVVIRQNYWTSIRYLEAHGRELSAILIEDRVLVDSSIGDHLPRRAKERTPRLIALRSAKAAINRDRLVKCGVDAIIRKPYELTEVCGALQISR